MLRSCPQRKTKNIGGGGGKTITPAHPPKPPYSLSFYVPQSVGNINASLISQRYLDPSNILYHGRGIYIQNGQIFVWTRGSDSVFLPTCLGSYNFDRWTNVTLVQDGTLLSGYVDGVLKSRINIGSSSVTGRYMSYYAVGAYTDSSSFYFKGYIANTQIFDRALTDIEVAAMQ